MKITFKNKERAIQFMQVVGDRFEHTIWEQIYDKVWDIDNWETTGTSFALLTYYNQKNNEELHVECRRHRHEVVMRIVEDTYKPELIYSFYNMYRDMHYDRMCIDNVGRQWNRRKKYYKPRKNLYVAF